jgi:hypothetical protein
MDSCSIESARFWLENDRKAICEKLDVSAGSGRLAAVRDCCPVSPGGAESSFVTEQANPRRVAGAPVLVTDYAMEAVPNPDHLSPEYQRDYYSQLGLSH